MTLKEITQYKTDITSLIDGGRLYEAIVKLQPVVEDVADYNLIQQLNTAKVSYDYLLQYFLDGVKDDGRNDMIDKITESLYLIADKCVIVLSAKQSFELFYTKASVLRGVSVADLVSKHQNLQKKYELLTGVDAESQNARAISDLKREKENVVVDLFNKAWCSFPLVKEDSNELKEWFAYAEEYEKQLVLSAMFLGQTKFYDEAKLVFLLESYITASDIDTQTRALTGAFLVMMLYPHRVGRSKFVGKLLAEASENVNFRSDVSSVMQRLVRSRNAENVSKRMREELMPNIMNMDPGLVSKLKGKGAIDPMDLEENPQWQEWLNKSGVSKKMEELNKLQTEGEDVFISTFSHLKSFPFFNVMANWFLPFYPTHSSLEDSFPAESRKMVKIIKYAPFLCDSDKYSFCFSLASVPDSQKSAMMGQMDIHSTDLQELESTELPDDKKKSRDASINGYIQSLYRFFTLFSRKNDFLSVFKSDMDFTQLPFFELWGLDQTALLTIAEYYLKNGFYEDAVSYFSYIQKHFEDVAPHILQKMGFAYQNLGDYRNAIQYYQRYELVDENDLWNNRHIAICYRSLKQYEKALKYYEKVLSVKDSNATMCLNAGHCLLELDRPDEALNYYYKADYLDPYNPKVWRSLAWANFLTDNFAQSENYYKKLLENNSVNSQDYLNYGHLLLAEGKLAEAVDCYVKSAKGERESLKAFHSSFRADLPVMVRKGITESIAALVEETVVKKLNNN